MRRLGKARVSLPLPWPNPRTWGRRRGGERSGDGAHTSARDATRAPGRRASREQGGHTDILIPSPTSEINTLDVEGSQAQTFGRPVGSHGEFLTHLDAADTRDEAGIPGS